MSNRLYFNIFVLLVAAVILLLMLNVGNHTLSIYDQLTSIITTNTVPQCSAIPVTKNSKFAHLPRIKCRQDLAKEIQQNK